MPQQSLFLLRSKTQQAAADPVQFQQVPEAVAVKRFKAAVCQPSKLAKTTQTLPCSSQVDCCTQIDGRFALSSRCCSQVHCKMGTGKQNFSLRQRRPVPKICNHRHPDGWFSLSSHCCSQGPCKMDMWKQQISLPQHRLALGIGSRMSGDDLLALCVCCWSLTDGKQDRHIGNSVLSALRVVYLPARSSPCWPCCLPAFYLLSRLYAFLRPSLFRLSSLMIDGDLPSGTAWPTPFKGGRRHQGVSPFYIVLSAQLDIRGG